MGFSVWSLSMILFGLTTVYVSRPYIAIYIPSSRGETFLFESY